MDISDDAEIRALIARIAFLSDEGDIEEYDSVYTEDAVWSAGSASNTGLAEIKASTRARRIEGSTGPGSHNRHITVPVDVHVDGDRASAVSYFLFVGSVNTDPQIRRFAVYDDAFVRTPQGWRCASRTIRQG